jgi:hypothetical protein
MSRIRRFALLAVLALAAGVVLSGCGTAQPGTAAYVDGTRYTEKQVDAIAAELRRSAVASQVVSARIEAVRWLVLGDLARRAAAERSITVPGADYAGIAAQLGLPQSSLTARTAAEWIAARNAVVAKAEPVAPSQDDVRNVYEALKLDPQFPKDVTFEQAAGQIQADPDLPLAVGVRNIFDEVANKSDVVVNPRYRPLFIDFGSLRLVVAAGSDLVTDLPRA